MKKLETFDSIYFHGKSHFEDNCTQNWLVLQPLQRHFKAVRTNNSCIVSRIFWWKYSGYGIRFDRKGSYAIGDEVGRNVIIFGVDMSSSPYIGNKKNDILILGKSPTQGLEHTVTAEKLYSINFTKENTTFCLSFRYIVIYSLMVQILLNLKRKIMKLLHI